MRIWKDGGTRKNGEQYEERVEWMEETHNKGRSQVGVRGGTGPMLLSNFCYKNIKTLLLLSV